MASSIGRDKVPRCTMAPRWETFISCAHSLCVHDHCSLPRGDSWAQEPSFQSFHLLQEEGYVSPSIQQQEKQHKEFCTGGSDGPVQKGHRSFPLTFHWSECTHGAGSNSGINWNIQSSTTPKKKRKWVWWIAGQLLPYRLILELTEDAINKRISKPLHYIYFFSTKGDHGWSPSIAYRLRLCQQEDAAPSSYLRYH